MEAYAGSLQLPGEIGRLAHPHDVRDAVAAAFSYVQVQVGLSGGVHDEEAHRGNGDEGRLGPDQDGAGSRCGCRRGASCRRPRRRSTPIQLIRAPAGIGMVRRHRRSGGVLGHILGRSGCLFWGHRRAGGSVAWKTIQLRSGRAHPFFHSFTNDGQMHKPLSLSQNCNNVRMSGMFNISCGSIRVWGDDGSPDLCGQRVNSLWQNRSPPPFLKNRAGGKGKKKSSLKTTKEDASGKIEV
mmetsp:Transcript_17856/g.42200  ORF Transcript_17856/g.42200 Transcript_17856/m.42200 type:complete len:239 (+) Transcript_17856:1796-2512(+)